MTEEATAKVMTREENPVGSMKAQARAAGLAESEVEKISTCPLVRLLVRQ